MKSLVYIMVLVLGMTISMARAHNPLTPSESREIRQLAEKCREGMEWTLSVLLNDAKASGSAPDDPDAIRLTKLVRGAATIISRRYGEELQMMALGETHQDRRRVLLRCANGD